MYLYNICWSSSPFITLYHSLSSVFLSCPSPLLTFIPCFLFLMTHYLNRVDYVNIDVGLCGHEVGGPKSLSPTLAELLTAPSHAGLVQTVIAAVFTRTKAVLHPEHNSLAPPYPPAPESFQPFSEVPWALTGEEEVIYRFCISWAELSDQKSLSVLWPLMSHYKQKFLSVGIKRNT